jgi:hypothetical protein
MSPEQLRGSARYRNDLFSLGFSCTTSWQGHVLRKVELAAIISQVLYKNPRAASEVISDIPATLDASSAAPS